MRKLPVQQDRSALLEKARVYSPTWHPVTEPIAEVIRTVLVRGVQCHGQGSIVAGIPTYRVLCEVGSLLAQFLPEVLALGGRHQRTPGMAHAGMGVVVGDR